jgi:hypothetical protein
MGHSQPQMPPGALTLRLCLDGDVEQLPRDRVFELPDQPLADLHRLLLVHQHAQRIHGLSVEHQL